MQESNLLDDMMSRIYLAQPMFVFIWNIHNSITSITEHIFCLNRYFQPNKADHFMKPQKNEFILSRISVLLKLSQWMPTCLLSAATKLTLISNGNQAVRQEWCIQSGSQPIKKISLKKNLHRHNKRNKNVACIHTYIQYTAHTHTHMYLAVNQIEQIFIALCKISFFCYRQSQSASAWHNGACKMLKIASHLFLPPSTFYFVC